MESSRGIAWPLYEYVEAARRRRGWTAVRLERESGVSRQTIDRWRNGRRAPLAETVLAVAAALDLDRDEALTLAKHGAPPPASAAPTYDDAIANKRNEFIAELGEWHGAIAFDSWRLDLMRQLLRHELDELVAEHGTQEGRRRFDLRVGDLVRRRDEQLAANADSSEHGRQAG